MSEPRTAAGRALLADLNAGAISVPEAGDAILAIEAEAASIDRAALERLVLADDGLLTSPPEDREGWRRERLAALEAARAVLAEEARRG